MELSAAAYIEIRDILLGAGYDYLVFPDFGSFAMPTEFIIRNRERSKL